jgi:3-phosphoshikimate 1-carboxyvinyltransferase
MIRKLKPADSRLIGTLRVPGDKSISHRAVMLGALANGKTTASGFLNSADCRSTIECFRAMGVPISVDESGTRVKISGKGLHGLSAPEGMLDCGNSGTTTRLMSGILAGQNFESRLSGDASIEKRPMNRIVEPLTQMNALVISERGNGCAPLSIIPSRLHGITYRMPVASAQVKSCILLAGLYADSPTTVIESAPSRNHTELMLEGFGASIRTAGSHIMVSPEPDLTACELTIPGDISSAAYFIAAALMVPESEVILQNVGVNPTRSGILDVIQSMGGTVELLNKRVSGGEPYADLYVHAQDLHGCEIGGALIPRLIDELPVIAVLAAHAQGTTTITDAQELRVKESDRIQSITEALDAMGAAVTPTDDGMVIEGGKQLSGATIQTHKDHRIAMAFAVASLIANGETTLVDSECINISYPNFYRDLAGLLREQHAKFN